MATNLNSFPYYDDFKEDKNFYQILFKPGFSVQARELTQLQSILRDQITKFGNHVFQEGSVVIPGNAYFDMESAYVKVTQTNLEEALYQDKILVGSISGVKAKVRKIIKNASYSTIHVAYTSGGSAGAVVFQPNEVLTVEGTPTLFVNAISSNPTGFGSLAFINAGVYYTKGTFVSLERQSIAIESESSTPTGAVVLQVSESVVTSFEDETLLDPSQGSLNFAAPGADRLKITLTLAYLPNATTLTEDFIEIARFVDGEVTENNRFSKYSELEKNLARRTFDESGDYIVSGLVTNVFEHLKVGGNGGKFSAANGGNVDKLAYVTNPGKAYIGGFEIEKLAKTILSVDKARTPEHVKTKTNNIVRPDFGQFFYVSNLSSLPSFRSFTSVDFYNDDDALNGSATKVASAKLYAIDYVAGDPTTSSSVYKVFFTDLIYEPGYTQDSIGGIRYSGGSMSVLQALNVPGATLDFTVGEIVSYLGGTRVATVHRWEAGNGRLYVKKTDHTKAAPETGDIITGGTSGATATIASKVITTSSSVNTLLFALSNKLLKSVRNASNVADIEYTTWKELSITTSGAGNGTTSVTGASILPLEVGNFLAVSSSGIVDITKFSLDVTGTVLTLTAGPASTSVKIFATVLKKSIVEKTKTKTIATITKTPASIISLDKADAIRVISVSDGTTDFVNSYSLDTGQTDFYYGISKLVARPNYPLPTSNVTIQFEYFSHSSSGDYFTVDSYVGLGADYIEQIPNYTSKTTGQKYNLQGMIDFRPRVGDNGLFTGPNAVLSDVIQTQSRIISSIKYFVGRIDMVTLNRDKSISVYSGNPDDKPGAPATPSGTIPLTLIYVPPYTFKATDVSVKNSDNIRYTMADISKLEKRVANLEYYATLSASENSLVNYSIVDPETGLERYKTGYLVDKFQDTQTGNFIGDVFNKDFSTVNYSGALTCSGEIFSARFGMKDTSTFYASTNQFVTLPYTYEKLAEQKYSTRITNVNPFNVFSWVGNMLLYPNTSILDEEILLPEIFISEEETQYNDIFIKIPPIVYPPPAPAPVPPIVIVEPPVIVSGPTPAPTPQPTNPPVPTTPPGPTPTSAPYYPPYDYIVPPPPPETAPPVDYTQPVYVTPPAGTEPPHVYTIGLANTSFFDSRITNVGTYNRFAIGGLTSPLMDVSSQYPSQTIWDAVYTDPAGSGLSGVNLGGIVETATFQYGGQTSSGIDSGTVSVYNNYGQQATFTGDVTAFQAGIQAAVAAGIISAEQVSAAVTSGDQDAQFVLAAVALANGFVQ